MSLVAAVSVFPEYPSVEEVYAALTALLRTISQADDLADVRYAASAALSQLLGIPEG